MKYLGIALKDLQTGWSPHYSKNEILFTMNLHKLGNLRLIRQISAEDSMAARFHNQREIKETFTRHGENLKEVIERKLQKELNQNIQSQTKLWENGGSVIEEGSIDGIHLKLTFNQNITENTIQKVQSVLDLDTIQHREHLIL
jgi:hypothetical protein